jgi:hypothetical protein
MVYVVIICVILRHHLQRVERETVPAMVIDSLESRNAEQERGLTSAHTGQRLGDDRAERVQQEALYRVIVQSTERVWDVEAVMPRVEMPVQKLVHVHVSVEEVLPSVDGEASK